MRNIEFHERELLKLIETERRAHEAVESSRLLLSDQVAQRAAIEHAIKRLSE